MYNLIHEDLIDASIWVWTSLVLLLGVFEGREIKTKLTCSTHHDSNPPAENHGTSLRSFSFHEFLRSTWYWCSRRTHGASCEKIIWWGYVHGRSNFLSCGDFRKSTQQAVSVKIDSVNSLINHIIQTFSHFRTKRLKNQTATLFRNWYSF